MILAIICFLNQNMKLENLHLMEVELNFTLFIGNDFLSKQNFITQAMIKCKKLQTIQIGAKDI